MTAFGTKRSLPGAAISPDECLAILSCQCLSTHLVVAVLNLERESHNFQACLGQVQFDAAVPTPASSKNGTLVFVEENAALYPPGKMERRSETGPGHCPSHKR